jgi:hypothetical protein
MTNTNFAVTSQGVLLENVNGQTAHAEESPVWHIDPTEWALRVSGRTRSLNKFEAESTEALPEALCVEVGRRLLLAELEFSDWTLRRVEKLDFVRDRSLSRCLTIDLNVREDAPVFQDLEGERYWLVPLSLMRRRTLVNFELRDMSGALLTMPGRVLTRQLDESILLAAASTVTDDPGDLEEVHKFVKKYVAGSRDHLDECKEEIEHPECSKLKVFFENDLFKATLSRFRHGWTQYLFLRKDKGRHRVVKVSFDEPADWKYHRSGLEEIDRGTWKYQRTPPDGFFDRRHLLAAFGLTPTRIRFQVPAAENAASYQLEITPPRGMAIVKANLLAGRPNDPMAPHVMVDGNPQEVALHACGVPNGSLCRAQVDLRIPTRGWLSKTLLSCAVVFGVLTSIWCNLSVFKVGAPNVGDAVRDAVVLLIATSAGVAAMLAERDFRGFTAHLVSKLRALGATTVGLPIVVACWLIYGTADPSQHQRMEFWIKTMTVVAFLLLAVTTAAWSGSRRAERRVGEESGDQTVDPDEAPKRQKTFEDALEYSGHERQAVVIRSAEAWHERYEWTNGLQDKAVTALSRPAALAHDRWCTIFGTSCKKESLSTQAGIVRCY